MLNKKRFLVLAPHTDDSELGMGGTIAKLIEEEKDVFIIAFSSAEKSVPEGYHKDILKREIRRAMKRLGVPEENLTLLEYETRIFPEYRQQILDDMIRLRKEIRPDVVFLPSSFDTHQDHKVIAEEGFRAFKSCSILGYEEAWNNMTFATTGFVRLEDRHIAKKIKALSGYQSQSKKFYMSPDFTKSLATLRGAQINTKYAEAFEIVRIIL